MLGFHETASEWADFGDDSSAFALDGAKTMGRGQSVRKRGEIQSTWMNAPIVHDEPVVPMPPPSKITSPKQDSTRPVSRSRREGPSTKSVSRQRTVRKSTAAHPGDSPSAKSLPARSASYFRNQDERLTVPLQVVNVSATKREKRSGNNMSGACTDSTGSGSCRSVPSQVSRIESAKRLDRHNKKVHSPRHSTSGPSGATKSRGRSLGHRSPTTRDRSKSKSHCPRSKSRSRSIASHTDDVDPHSQRGRSTSRRPTVPSPLAPRAAPRGRSVGSADRAATEPNRTLHRPCSRDRTPAGKRSSSSSLERDKTQVACPRPPLTQHNTTRSRSKNRTRSASLTRISNPGVVSPRAKNRGPPPSTYRTRQQLLGVGSPMRSRTRSEGDAVSIQSSLIDDSNILLDTTFGSHTSTMNGSEKSGKKKTIMEKLFGDQVDKPVPDRIAGSLGHAIRPRILLAATVYHNTATNLWITTINTNQRGVAKNPSTANKYLKAFSFPTEHEARESAIANAPPKMMPFNESPVCFRCKGQFAVFRRAGHCRNCGVCVCSSCTTSWPSKMIPATYNLKNETQVKVCCSCHSLSRSFKQALLEGDLDEAIALYGTGNINLRTPFPVSNKKDEIMQPIHCAVEGGNLNILRWLIDEHFCPIKTHRAKGKKGPHMDAMIVTSKGRSVLGIASDSMKIDIMRYLVVECGVSIYENKDLKSALAALEAALSVLPESISQPTARFDVPRIARWDHASFDDFSEPSSLGADDIMVDDSVAGKSARSRASSRNCDSCIICFDRKIDCVATPCGHQIICLECSQNLLSCPVCNDRTNFIKIFRP